MINSIAQSLRYKSCIVETNVGEKIVKIKDINYVNIEDRSACYHLNTGNTIKSLKLRTSFNKATSHLLVNTNLYFLSPGLILNSLFEALHASSTKIVFTSSIVLI